MGLTIFLDKVISVNGRAPKAFTRFVKYCLVGLTTSSLEILTLFVLVHFVSVYYLIATAFAFAASDSLGFALNLRWGFKESKTGALRGYFLFISFSVMALILTLLFMKILVDVIGIYYLLARVIILVFIGTLLFLLNYIFTFKLASNKDELKFNF